MLRAKKSTINDVARLAGVSKKTVSRVINKSTLVRKETYEKVEKVIAELKYSPDPQARGLASTVEHPTLGTLTVPEQPVHFSGAPRGGRQSAPALGAHTQEILHQLQQKQGEPQ